MSSKRASSPISATARRTPGSTFSSLAAAGTTTAQGQGQGEESGEPAAKRQRLDDYSSSASKAALTSAAARAARQDDGEGDESEEEEDPAERQLEEFRKEAIHRQMLEYKRLASRAQRAVEDLKSERKRQDARLAAIDLSWNSLVEEAALLLPSTSSAPNGTHASDTPSVADASSANSGELEAALAQRTSATKDLLARLAHLSPPSTEDAESRLAQLSERCSSLLQEAQKSREDHRLLSQEHTRTLAELEQTRDELSRAERRFDRARARTVAALEKRPLPLTKDEVAADSPAPAAVGGASSPRGSTGRADTPATDKRPNGSATPAGAPTGAATAGGTASMTGQGEEQRVMVEELRALADMRAKTVDTLRSERVALSLEIDALKLRLAEVPDSLVLDSVPFKVLQTHLQYVLLDHDARKRELERTAAEANESREQLAAQREQLTRDAQEQLDALERRLQARDTDLARVRALRDEARAEVMELKAREQERHRAAEQAHTLAKAREERLRAFGSELARLRMRLAAKDADVAQVESLATNEAGSSDDVDVDARLAKAEQLVRTLRDQLESKGEDVDARVELAGLRTRLAELEKSTAHGTDVAALQATIARLEAELKASEHGANMLYSEIDRLSSAWATLDEQAKHKVWNLQQLEDKVQKLVTEKAKADNRYFAAMRQKDATVAENAVLVRLSEKQAKAIEAANELHASLSAQVASVEKEVTLHQNAVRAHRDKIAELQRENHELAQRHQSTVKVVNEQNVIAAERLGLLETERANSKRLEEQNAKLEREIASAKAAAAAAATAAAPSTSSTSADPAQVRELREHNADLSAMLKCSTCRLRFKAVIITRCMHLFCRECVDARLANRQRKCPTCGAAFGKDDVSQIFL